jgi:hypothetical protein
VALKRAEDFVEGRTGAKSVEEFAVAALSLFSSAIHPVGAIDFAHH